jgi:ketosteroid isomerase-like protein
MGPRGMRIRGRENLDRYWQSITNPKSWRLDVFEVGGSRDEPWQLGRSTLVTTSASGQDQSSIVDFIVLWRRQSDGQLRIYIDMYPGGGS